MDSPTGPTRLTDLLGVRHPIIGGPMYPCSNPELVAAVSNAGGLGVLQPVSLVYVFGHDFREGVRHIRSLTDGPIGMNIITERSSKRYLDRMERWLDIALEEGVRFFTTSLGDPRWVVERAAPFGGLVFHDVTERRFADKAAEAGVHGLIAVNCRAGGHTGSRSPAELLDEVGSLGLPVVCAGGIGDAAAYREALALGYDGALIGTRLIASAECTAAPEYKQAIVDSGADDIVLTHRITGVPVSVIRTPEVAREGTEPGPILRWLLAHPKLKHPTRAITSLRSISRLGKAHRRGRMSHKDYLLAGRSVAGITAVEPVHEIIERWTGGP